MGTRRHRFAERRKARGLSQERLAEAVGVEASTVARWERGRTTPQPVYRPKLAEALQVTVEEVADLLGDPDASDTSHMRLMQRAGPTGSGPFVASRRELEPVAQQAQSNQPPEPTMTVDAAAADSLFLGIRIDRQEVVMPLNRRALLRGGVGSLLGVFALEHAQEATADAIPQSSVSSVTVHSPAHLDEILVHLREQWHGLVRTDNLFGPRFAIAGVRNQIAVIDAVLNAVDSSLRAEVVRLGARYAESAAWLYEDANDLPRSRYWLSRAVEWAYEVDDTTMLAWTAYRRSHQAAQLGDAAKAIGLAQAARREESRLPTSMRAAIRVQEARGRALGGDDAAAQRILDEAHSWAASDAAGDARDGHGSFCTPGYIEINRADCLTLVNQPKKAIAIYEQALPSLPTVYQRDRAAGFSRLAAAHVLAGQPEKAAKAAHTALPAARGAGSKRTLQGLQAIAAALEPHRGLAPVGALLEDLRQDQAA